MLRRSTAIALLLSTVLAGGCAGGVKVPVVDRATLQDASVTAAVKTALLNDTRVDGTLVTVRTQGGVVHLGGTQPTPDAAAEVVSVVRSVEGVRDVQTSIAVAPADTADADARR